MTEPSEDQASPEPREEPQDSLDSSPPGPGLGLQVPEKVDRRRSKYRNSSKRKRKRERCRICNKVMDRVDAVHLREHGYTKHRYDRTYGERGPLSTSSRAIVGSVTDPRAELVSNVAERITEDKVWVACLADEVGERMMNGPLRQRLSWMLTTMLAQRASIHGQSIAILNGALAELSADWRVKQAANGSGPVPTDELLRVVEKAGKLISDSEAALHRTMKLALDEQRTNAEFADTAGPALYQGTGEQLEMPSGVTAGDREIIRSLLTMVGKHANEANTVDVTPLPPTPGGDPPPPAGEVIEEHGDGSAQVPADDSPTAMP